MTLEKHARQDLDLITAQLEHLSELTRTAYKASETLYNLIDDDYQAGAPLEWIATAQVLEENRHYFEQIAWTADELLHCVRIAIFELYAAGQLKRCPDPIQCRAENVFETYEDNRTGEIHGAKREPFQMGVATLWRHAKECRGLV